MMLASGTVFFSHSVKESRVLLHKEFESDGCFIPVFILENRGHQSETLSIYENFISETFFLVTKYIVWCHKKEEHESINSAEINFCVVSFLCSVKPRANGSEDSIP